jgi:hypothetical protein
MAKRCEHCKHWVDTAFKGQSESGYGVWFGNCSQSDRPMKHQESRHSLMLACEHFEHGTHPSSLNALIEKNKVLQ